VLRPLIPLPSSVNLQVEFNFGQWNNDWTRNIVSDPTQVTTRSFSLAIEGADMHVSTFDLDVKHV